MLLIPKNWAVFQHYKNRLPHWIKLHRELLNDRVYMSLPLASKAIAPLMWLLASESKNGSFDGSLDELVFRLHITEKDYRDGVKPLIDKGFFIDASKLIADCQQVATPERETETERETEKTSICPPNGEPKAKKLPECDHKAVIELYHQNLPTMRRVEVWNETRAGYLRQRWREVAAELAQAQDITAFDVLNWWGEFFQSVGKSRFLTGRVNSKNGRAFVADLEWILKPSNFAKIVEGKYHGNN
jgi:hypothetical protein